MNSFKTNILIEKVQEFLENESSGHDIYHAQRVMKLAEHIQKKEGGDLEVITISALVHDIYRPWEKKTSKSHFGPEAMGMLREFLEPLVTDSEIVEKVIKVVSLHDIYDWTHKHEKSIELQIMQDADNLDASGAIGIARTFTFGGAYKLDMYIPGESLDFSSDFVEDPNHRTSTIAHFYEKLLKLRDNMNTQTGKELAEYRHNLMKEFLKEFFKEWEVELT